MQPVPATTALARLASRGCLPVLIAKQARLRPREDALVDGARCISHGELETRVRRLADYLECAGLRKGDRVALLSENGSAYLELAIAAAKRGVMLALLNWRLTPRELQDCLALVDPALVFVSAAHAAAIAPESLPEERRVLLDAPGGGARAPAGCLARRADRSRGWPDHRLHQRHQRSSKSCSDQPSRDALPRPAVHQRIRVSHGPTRSSLGRRCSTCPPSNCR